MSMLLTIPQDLQARVDALASRSRLTASEVIADALENGYSLDWQEGFLDKVAAGILAAESGDFATADEVMQVVNKFRAT